MAIETSCEGVSSCDSDVSTGKGLMLRWLASVAQLAPFVADKILPELVTTAQAAIDQCTGGKSGRQCGFYWADGEYVESDTNGAIEQMAVFHAVSSLLVGSADPPATESSEDVSSNEAEDDSDNGSHDVEDGPTPAKSGSPEVTEDSGAVHTRTSIATLVVVGLCALALV